MPLQILVLDGDAATPLCGWVRAAGHRCIHATGLPEALTALDALPVDAVLLREAAELARTVGAIRRAPHGGPVAVWAVGGAQPADRLRALDAGADDLLPLADAAALLAARLARLEGAQALQPRAAADTAEWQAALAHLPDPVLVLDPAGHVRFLNDAARQLRHADGEPIAPGALATRLLELSRAEPAEARACDLHRSDGSGFRADVVASSWEWAGERRTTLVLRDTTALLETQRIKDEFLATVNHELRTPLTSVLASLGLLAGGAAGAMEPRAMQLVDAARRNGVRLGRLIDDVLDLTKIEANRLELHLSPHDAVALVQEALAANQSYAAAARVELVADLPAPRPRFPPVSVDADRFLQVMANLLSNAIKHSPPGSSVRVQIRQEGDALCVSVRDRGPGIPAAYRPRLFDKFSQADASDRRTSGGTGLGLHITRLLVERMRGRVRVDEVEAGASFSVLLPLGEFRSVSPPLLLAIGADPRLPALLTAWLGELARVQPAASLDAASACIHEASALLADPAGQGDADRFCRELRRLADGRPILLVGESLDASYAERVHLPWLPARAADGAAVRDWVRQAVAGSRP